MDQLIFWIAVVVGLLVLAFLYRALRRRRQLFSEAELTTIRDRFKDLEKRAYWDPRHTILEGDKLLDLLLTKRGYAGTLGEKLKKADRQFACIQELWDAHKLRNRIAHELDVKIEPRDAKRAIVSYKKAYRSWGVDLE